MFSPEMPELRALELLDAIARTGSITLAAGELDVTQQAASIRLRRLEERLGVPLVVRAARSSSLTSDGQQILALAAPVLQAARTFDIALQGRFGGDSSLSVAASMTVADHFLPRWLGRYVAAGHDASSVRSTVTNTREVVRLVSESEVELGFVEGDAPPRGLRYRFLAYDELTVFVAPSHRWAQSGHVSPWTLAQTPLVSREHGSGCRAVMTAALAHHGLDRGEIVAPALELPSNTAVLEAAAAGVAPAVISVVPADAYVADGRLVPVRVDRVAFRRHLGAVWRGGGDPPTRPARDLLDAALADRPPRSGDAPSA